MTLRVLLQKSLTRFLRLCQRYLFRGSRTHRNRVPRRQLEEILSRSAAPIPISSKVVFDTLQATYQCRPDYGYDAYSTWRRGNERAQHLIGLDASLRDPGRHVLEVACGDAMAGYLLQGYGHHVQLTDASDWRDSRAMNIPFTLADVCKELPYTDNIYDLVFSYNAFEHFADPATALREMIRVCRVGGIMFFSFGPLYASPWGLHAYRMLRMPYPQFLFSPERIRERLDNLGIFDLGQKLSELQFTNQWRVDQFHALWDDKRCEIIDEHVYRETAFLDVIERFPECFQGRGLTYDDVTIQGMYVTLRKIKSDPRPKREAEILEGSSCPR